MSGCFEIGPNQDSYVTVYFDNAKGTPKAISIDELYVLDNSGLPSSFNGATVRIELSIQD